MSEMPAQTERKTERERPTDESYTAVEPIMQFFHYSHLPPQLQEVSVRFWDVACALLATLPRNPERTVALRKLLEAKDAAVRARLYQ